MTPTTIAKPRPTISALEPLIWGWAVERGLIDDKGKPAKATPQTQFGKTVEEIGEAKLITAALLKAQTWKGTANDFMFQMLKELSPKDYKKLLDAQTGSMKSIVEALRLMAATEFGDVLVTLSLLSRMFGTTLEQSIKDISNCPQLYLRGVKPQAFDHIDYWADEVQREIVQGVQSFRPMMGVMYRCVESAAGIQLSMSTPECLELAWLKIKDREGQTVDGVFVKAGD